MNSSVSRPSVDAVLDVMREYLAAHERLDAVASHWNGFEGWLKFELATELRRRLQVVPWQRNTGGKWERGQIGVEYRHKREERGEPEKAKLIDLWVGNPGTLYFELKVAFANGNATKQIRSWRADFEKLRVVLEGEEGVDGFASVLVSVGHDDRQWTRAIAEAQDDPRFYGDAIVSNRCPEDVGAIRFAALRSRTPMAAAFVGSDS